MKKYMEKIPLLGVFLTTLSLPTLQRVLKNCVNDRTGFYTIVTPNPEIILKANASDYYRRTLNEGDFSLPDGVGLYYANHFLSNKKLNRITGIDTSIHLLNLFEKRKSSLLIIIPSDGLSSPEIIASYFKEKYPLIKLTVLSYHKQTKKLFFEKINQLRPDGIFCTLGAPHQELLINEIKKKANFPCVAISNGATVDFLVGTQKRAPKLFQKTGIEWLWRLIKQPNRWRRIFNAVIVFPLFVVFWRLRRDFIYRHTVLAYIKNSNNEILLGYFPEASFWGFPKGGRNHGEKLEQTACREVFEEFGIPESLLKINRIKKKIYRYEWSSWFRSLRGFRGQVVSVVFMEYIGSSTDINVDNYEATDYKWVSEDILETVLSPQIHELAHKIKNF